MVQFILYVVSQVESKNFYAHLLSRQPILDVPGMTEFLLEDNCKLGLMPNEGINRILNQKTPHPSTGNGIPRCELYLYPDDIFEVQKRLHDLNALEISPLADRDWGDKVGYYSDPDGHIIAIAQKI